jgi:hypothetical protein
MPLNLKPTSADEIDAEIRDIYKGRLGGGELKQLAKLFRDAALPKRLKAVLTPTLAQTGSGYSERLDIKVAWIDKRPLAALEGRSWKVELGDAAVFFFDVLEYGGGKMNQRQSRALLLQAKAASQSRQMEKPSVPVNPPHPPPDNSTAHELELLSQWGKFDLYATSGNKEPAARGIAVKPKTLPPPYGWYMATPQRRPRRGERAAWASPWMCAPAVSGAPCDLSLGKLLAAFLSSAGTTAGGSAIPAVGAASNSNRLLIFAQDRRGGTSAPKRNSR